MSNSSASDSARGPSSFSLDAPVSAGDSFNMGGASGASAVGGGQAGATLTSPSAVSSVATTSLPSISLSEGNGSQPILLNISEASVVKKMIQEEHLRFGKMSGNMIVDTFYRLNDWMISHSSVTVKDLAAFFRLLAVMINAGVPLIKSLETLAIQMAPSPKLSHIISDVGEKVSQGKSLSDAMAVYGDVFDDSQIGMLRSGEATGQLNKVLLGLADRLEKNSSMQSKIIGALIYPCVIVGLLVAVVIVMMVVVVPKMTDFFVQSGKELPTPTKVLLVLSGFFQNYWMLIVFGGIGLVVGISMWRKTVMGRYQWDQIMLKIPLFGTLIGKGILARFARLLSDMLESGVQVVPSLKIIASAIGNEVYRQRLLMSAQDVEQGIPLAESLNDPKLFPVMLINMIQIGEQTAHLDNVCERIASLYDDEVDSLVKGLTKAFEPILLILIGVVVGGMVAAIMLPIMDMSNLGTNV